MVNSEVELMLVFKKLHGASLSDREACNGKQSKVSEKYA